MPRCGVPDIINGTTRMTSGKKNQRHSSTSFHTVSHYTFFPGSPKWPPSKYSLTYGFLPQTPSRAMDPVAKAFQTWAANTHFRFARVQDYTTADIKIGFYRGNHGDGSSFDGRGGILAHAFAPQDGRFHYDADETWAVGATPGAHDLETVALHEIGHLLGLGHSSVEAAIMFARISSGSTKGLHSDDIQGIRALYNGKEGVKTFTYIMPAWPRVEWKTPPINVLKWNIDGLSVGQLGESGIRGLLRDYGGNIKCLFSCPNRELSSNQAELKAMIKALQISKDLIASSHGNHAFIFETDSSNILTWINGSSERPWRDKHLIMEALNLIAQLPHTLFLHTDREANSLADNLAKLGCHKGDKLKGIHELKTYLEHFGYLNYKNQSQANNDDFDDLLESALKTYQLNYHLKVTGTLDSQTVSKMMMPRCGVPDIINGTTRMTSGKKNQRHSSTSFHTVSHYTFFPGSPKWPPSKYSLTYGFLPQTPSRAMDPVARAFQTWAANTHFRFARVQDYTTADIKIGFYRGNHGDGSSFDGRGGILAHAFAPQDGRFHYDADETWAVGATPGAIDLETVALHEIGHLLGLGHSSVEGAIMFARIPPGSAKGLHSDDIQGIRALYKSGMENTTYHFIEMEYGWIVDGATGFARVQDYTTADIKIGFYRGNHGDGSSFDGRGGVLAHAFAPQDGRFHYDADETWVVGATPGAHDLETVALHEIGHLLGLGHSSVEAAIMFASISSGSTKGLHRDDIQGIRALYNGKEGVKTFTYIMFARPRVEWKTPPTNVLKWNIDGSSVGQLGESGIRGVLRDYGGNIKCLFSCPNRELSSNQAESKAMIKALQISKDLIASSHGNRAFIFETDSSNILAWINGSSERPWRDKHLIMEALNLIAQLPHTLFLHTDKEANSLADNLAKLGKEREDDFLANG
ncbi:hypothetical protein GH714_041526 [Hevea brasiliensis]|uniref:RNase H type-1 domain-containing protein n=1 Tax=Hevea brasiliensis TaxID=3981 RepID=A0A6A6MUD0_HEVBR|nr:hypothetical protein GH714_041526 [Hevea brasiliensis]